MMTLTLSSFLVGRGMHKFITIVVAAIVGIALQFLLARLFPQMSPKLRNGILYGVLIVIVTVAIFVFPSN